MTIASTIGAAGSAIQHVEGLGHVGHVEERRPRLQDRGFVRPGPRAALEIPEARSQQVVRHPGEGAAGSTRQLSEPTGHILIEVERRAHR